MKDVNIVLGSNIQMYRRAIGMTQEHLADILGVTYQAISKWENGKCMPDIALLPELARLFGCSIDDLFITGKK